MVKTAAVDVVVRAVDAAVKVEAKAVAVVRAVVADVKVDREVLLLSTEPMFLRMPMTS